MPCSAGSGPRRFLVALAILMVGAVAAAQTTASTPPAGDSAGLQAVHVLGLEGIKHRVKGKLTFSADSMKFTSAATNNQIAVASIEDISTGQDSRQVGGKVLTVAKMGIPYSGGRFLSLFTHEKFDTLTIEYRDSNGALHGLVFTMPLGQAQVAKAQLLTLGAKSSTPIAEAVPAEVKDTVKKEKQ